MYENNTQRAFKDQLNLNGGRNKTVIHLFLFSLIMCFVMMFTSATSVQTSVLNMPMRNKGYIIVIIIIIVVIVMMHTSCIRQADTPVMTHT
jgi:hypothetical protein